MQYFVILETDDGESVVEYDVSDLISACDGVATWINRCLHDPDFFRREEGDTVSLASVTDIRIERLPGHELVAVWRRQGDEFVEQQT